MEKVLKNIEVLDQLIEEGRELDIMKLISKLHPADIADLIDALDEDKKKKLFGLLQVETASDVIMEIDEISRELIMEDISQDKLTQIVDDMESDDATDLISELPEEQAQQILREIDREDSEEVQELLKYDKETAGGIMQLELVSVPESVTVKDAIEQIRSSAGEVEDLHNVFIVNGGKKLVGVLPLRKLILASPDGLVKSIMDSATINVTPEVDQEEVADIFRKYDIVSLPVIDHEGTLLGRILVDDVVDVIEKEDSEDIMKMAGIPEEELIYGSHVFEISRARLPWLITNLFGGLLTGYLMWLFRITLHEVLALITFIPVITAMGGNVGIQSSSIMIRGFAVGRVDFNNLRRILFKEMKIGLIMGIACGIVAGCAAMLWHKDPLLGPIVALAMVTAITTAASMGTLIPAFFKKMNIDPAIAAGPFVTTANDIVGILIYLGIATFFLKFLMVGH
ncbi:MAG: magnesium transporter [Deltaproteobacteria bacterium]|nr:magnesium transporter [Deltaproteobacteria bacterium]